MERVLFIATEPHMLQNFNVMIQICERNEIPYFIYINHLQSKFNSFSVTSRILHGCTFLRMLRNDIYETVPNSYLSDTVVIYSNAEGFVMSNRKYWMPQLKNCIEVCIQHGLMECTIPSHKRIRNVVNLISGIWGLSLFGLGFGSIKTDYIIVYSNFESSFLRNTQEWKESSVISCGRLLKEYQSLKPDSSINVCELFLQDLTALGYTIKRQEEIIGKTVKILQKEFSTVKIRKHPKMGSPFDFVNDFKEQGCLISESVNLCDDLNDVDFCFSYFSTALLDAWLMGKKVVAIEIENIDMNLYSIFNRRIRLDDLSSYLKSCSSDNEAFIKVNRFNVATNPEKTFLKLFNSL